MMEVAKPLETFGLALDMTSPLSFGCRISGKPH